MRRLLALVLALAVGFPFAATAQEQTEEQAEEVVIGLVTLEDDPRYQQDWGYARLVVPPPVRSVEGAQMAVEDLAFVADSVGLAPRIAERAASRDTVLEAVQALMAEGAQFVLLDLPGDMVETISTTAVGMDVTLINVSAPENDLRTACRANLLHAYPSDRQMMDSFAQYLRAKDWTGVLILQGDYPRDAVLADAFTESAERLRLDIRDHRPFTLAADPASREGNNVALLTGGARYDTVFVADDRGEFGRFVPYATQLPRPVIGSIGLTAEAWHWAIERDGATQVSSRFDKAFGRRMTSVDWASWIAVKSVIQAMVRAPDQSREGVTAYMTSDDMRLDGSKGVQINYRPWSGQLRMPILLATSDAVIAIAPIEGFLHQTNVLDTLGVDEAEFRCR